MVPTNPSGQINLCDHPNITSYYNCSTVTLNELVDANLSYNPSLEGKTYTHEVKILSGIHVVNSTQSQYLQVSGKHTSSVSFLGDGNVYIICKSRLYFKFLNIEQTSVSNIHFKNCRGHSDEEHYHALVFQCSKQ